MSKIPDTLPKFLWFYSKRHLLGLSGLMFVAIFWGIYLSLSPYAMKLIIDKVADPGVNNQNLFYELSIPAGFYILLAFLLGVVFRLYDWIMIQTFPVMRGQITSEMFDHVMGHSYRYFQHHFAGNISNKINDITKGSVTIIHSLIDHFFARAFSVFIGAVTMFLVYPYFALVLGVWGILFLTISMYFSKRSHHYAEVYSESRSQVVGKIVDSISNILNIKLFAREGYESRYLRKGLSEAVVKDKNFHWYVLKVKFFQAIAITILIACMVFLLIYARMKNLVTIGDFALILTLTMSLIDEIFFIAQQLVTFSEDVGMCRQGLTIVSPKDTQVKDLANAGTLRITDGKIEFEKVTFHYRKGHAIFNNKSMVIEPGQKVGLVGFSGSGKSTFVNLILRFYDVDSGRILIDNQDIRGVTQESLRSQIAMIPQDPILFHRTVIENIRYGRLDASDDEVIECSKLAHCDEFILKMKDGYDALVGERGVKLSGGQRQRIAIARAILKNAPILILDEATSALDSMTESYIQESLAFLMQNRTTLVVAHRLSTLFDMDRILVFDNGKVIEDGTHSDLIESGGHYANLWNMQAGGFLGDYYQKLDDAAI